MSPEESFSSTIQGWLVRLRRGDPTARNELLAHVMPRVRDMCHRMSMGYPSVRRWEDTDTLLQGVLIRLDRALADLPLSSGADFFRLASTHVRRELIDLARKYKSLNEKYRTPVPDPGEDSDTLLRESVGPDSGEGSHWWESFHLQVEVLPPTTREVFELIWYFQMPQQTVADLLTISIRTVKRHWVEARLRLVESLGSGPPG